MVTLGSTSAKISATMISKSIINIRLLVVLFLGFSSGLPLALTSSTMQAWFTEANVNLATIGTLSLIGLPYTLKFLWAPIMDYVSFPWVGKRRGWILLTQSLLMLIVILFAQMNPAIESKGMIWVAITIAFLSASQDVAVDAYRTDILSTEERGIGSAYYVFAYRIALLVSGGLALIMADYLGWKVTYEIMALILGLGMIVTYLAPNVEEIVIKNKNLFQTMMQGLKDILQRDKIIYILLFLITYKIGDALALQLMTNFLLHGLNFSLTEVGVAYKLVGFLATISGAFLGGLILVRWDVYRALLAFGLAQAFSNLTFVVLTLANKSFLLMAASIFIENFCSGLTTAAFLAFIMSLCNHQYTAAQFALFSAITSLGRVLLGPVAAYMVAHFGWTQFYLSAFLLSFPGLFFLLLLKKEVLRYAPIAAD